MELVLIFLVVLLLFGAKRIPEIARSIGEGIKEFKKSLNSVSQDSGQKPAGDQKKPDNPSENS